MQYVDVSLAKIDLFRWKSFEVRVNVPKLHWTK